MAKTELIRLKERLQTCGNLDNNDLKQLVKDVCSSNVLKLARQVGAEDKDRLLTDYVHKNEVE